MATHEELVAIPFDDGKYRFCLDRVVRDDEDGRIEFAFVWRGNKRSPDGFSPRPAYFGWPLLGKSIRQAIVEGKIDADDAGSFLMALVGQSGPNESPDSVASRQ